jgi:hypothetical protein
MSNYIKSFDSFQKESVNEDFSLDSLMGYADKLFSSPLGGGIADATKQQVIAYLCTKLGVLDDPNSPGRIVLEEMASVIPAEDYLELLGGSSRIWNKDYFAPYLAIAVTKLIKRVGLDPMLFAVADKFGLDKNGYLIRVLRETIQNYISDEEKFEDKLTELFKFLLGFNVEISHEEFVSDMDPKTKGKIGKGLSGFLSTYENPLSKKSKESPKSGESGGSALDSILSGVGKFLGGSDKITDVR